MWLGAIGAASRNELLGIHYFVERLPGRFTTPIVEILVDLLTTLIALGTLYAAIMQIRTARFTVFASINVPKWVMSVGLAISMAFIAVLFLLRAIQGVKGDEQVARVMVKLQRGADLLDHAALKHDDLIGHGHGLDLVVGHIDHGRGQLFMQLGKLDPHLNPERRIQVRQRFVEQEDLGLTNDGAADGDALALTAGKVLGPTLQQGAEVQDVRRLGHFARPLFLGHAGQPQAERHVVGDRHVRVKRVGLKDHRKTPVRRADVVGLDPVDQQIAVGDAFKPAIMRSRVDLPQPDGPTKTTNSRSATSRSTPLMISTSPYFLRMFRRATVAMGVPLYFEIGCFT